MCNNGINLQKSEESELREIMKKKEEKKHIFTSGFHARVMLSSWER